MQFSDATKAVEDAAYVTIGFGVLAYQRAQVRRRELAAQLRKQGIDVRKQLEDMELGSRLSKLAERLEARIDPVVDSVTDRLPAPARTAFAQAREVAKEARSQLIERLPGSAQAAA